MHNIAKRHLNFNVTLHWSLEHKDIHRNEMADIETKSKKGDHQ